MTKFILRLAALTMTVMSLANCSGGASISVSTSGDSFSQLNNSDVKIDILWVIDDSGSMAPGQSALEQNFDQFINSFYAKGFDFRIAVTKTSAFLGNSLFVDGDSGDGFNSRVLSSTNLSQAQMEIYFSENALVGTSGTGDERALQSLEAALSNVGNANFPRAGAHLAVIFVGDEDDHSLTSVVSTHDYLMNLTGSTANNLSFSTHSIVVENLACRNSGTYGNDGVNPMHGAASIGTRLMEMSGYSNGLTLSICSPFGPSLSDLADDLATRASVFYLEKEPIISTIEVRVSGLNGGAKLPNSDINGYTYNADNNSIIFHGSMIPPQGSEIDVTYVPTSL